MKDGLFQFKRFSVSHSRSSMKVGVDGVLVGAWAACSGSMILDVGTGCGLIALMMAQRNSLASILAIDVDSSSVVEAAENFSRSEWSSRLEARQLNFAEVVETGLREYDLIVSNPPYFDSGVRDFTTARNVARHQGSLSPSSLIAGSASLLSSGGRLSMIVPAEFRDMLEEEGREAGLGLSRVCFVKGTPRKKAKRVMLEFSRESQEDTDLDELTMFGYDGMPTEEYLSLCREFYLKF